MVSLYREVTNLDVKKEKVSSSTFAAVNRSLIPCRVLVLRSLSPTLGTLETSVPLEFIQQGYLRDPLVGTSTWANKRVARLRDVSHMGAECRVELATSIY